MDIHAIKLNILGGFMKKVLSFIVLLTLTFSVSSPIFCNMETNLTEIIDKKPSTIKKAVTISPVKTVQAKATVVSTPPFVVIFPSLNVPQGNTFFVIVKSASRLQNPYIIFKNKKIKLFEKTKGNYAGYIGIDAAQKTGQYPLNLRDKDGKLFYDKIITVTPTKFPSQHITLSPSKSSLSPSKEELSQIEYVKNAFSDAAYFGKFPFNSPTSGCIASLYGLKRYYNGVLGGYHKGIDISAPQGQGVKALTGGVVTVANNFKFHGGTVGLNHGQGITTIYLHMSKLYVKPGQVVKEGDLIGAVGSTGIATGPHLHWGMYINGVSVNPYTYWTKPLNRCS